MELKHISEDHAAWYRESLEHSDLFRGELTRTQLRWSREFDRVRDCDLMQGRLSGLSVGNSTCQVCNG